MAPEATNAIEVPLTVMVSPGAKLVVSESVPAAPDSSVAPVIGAGMAALLLTAPPVIVADGSKKSSEALIAEAATSAVSLNVWIAGVSAACRLAVVAVVFAPIRNDPAGGGFVVVAVSVIGSVVPSGKLKLKVILSPSFGLVAPRSTVEEGGTPAGCVTVAPVSDDVTEPSFKPNAEPSSAILVTVVVAGGDETVRWPILPVPWSACRRSLINCFSPACVPLPLIMTSAGTVAGASVARPANK